MSDRAALLDAIRLELIRADADLRAKRITPREARAIRADLERRLAVVLRGAP